MSVKDSLGVAITGMGVMTSAGIGTMHFETALKTGSSNFTTLVLEHEGENFKFPVGQLAPFDLRSALSELGCSSEVIARARRLRNLSKSAASGLYCALEAWTNAGLGEEADPERVAIVIAGSNFQQAALYGIQEKYRQKVHFLPPGYGLSFFDSDLVGVVSEVLGVSGEGFSIGAASASGNLAIIQGCRLIKSGEYGLAVVVAPLMDLSLYEYQGFSSLGAMAELKEGDSPSTICRPFDRAHRGFVAGQSAGCLILESIEHAAGRGRGQAPKVTGHGTALDANRNPNPTAEGERRAMQKAMAAAQLSASDIQYVNTHGTSSPLGDVTEVEALILAGLEGVKANSTKGIIGHGLSAAGMVETIASLIQMKAGFLHPNRNLEQPVSSRISWVGPEAEKTEIRCCLSNSFAFGGLNTSLIFQI